MIVSYAPPMVGASQHTHFVAVFPSRDIRSIPSFVFSVPTGWILDEVPHTVTAVRLPEAVDGFWVNVLMTHDLVARSVDLEQAAIATLARVKQQCASLTLGTEKFARFGTRVCYLRSLEVVKQAGEAPLAQVHALFFGPVEGGGKVVDLFHLVGTCKADQLEQYGPAMVEIIASFRFT